MKQKIKIADNTFSHSILGYCSDFQKSENFEWERTQPNNTENLVITDNFLTLNLPPSKNKIAWLIEPVCVAPQHYDYVRNNLMKFDYILTHEKTLLDLDYNTKFIPFGCCWIPKEEQKVYDKSKNISAINFKIDGLKDYRFSVVIENCKRDYWFTEKLIDCFATGTIPIYWGCPSIGDFFNTDGMLIFDNMDELETILNDCNEDFYNSKLDVIRENFDKCKNFLLPDEHVYKFIKENL